MKNTIQVYGLPRSGTNFLEWTLKEYFKDVTYENLYKKCDVEELNISNHKVSVKHSYPSFEFSDKVIVIYKEYDKWENSYYKWMRKGKYPKIEPSKEIWEKYIEKSKELDSNSCILISHNELYTNYKNSITLFSNKFNLELKNKKIILPKGRFSKSGANAKPNNNTPYKHE